MLCARRPNQQLLVRSVQDLATRILVQPTRKPDLVTTSPDFLATGREALLWTEQSGLQNLDPDRLAARCFDRGDLLAGRDASGWFGWWEEEDRG